MSVQRCAFVLARAWSSEKRFDLLFFTDLLLSPHTYSLAPFSPPESLSSVSPSSGAAAARASSYALGERVEALCDLDFSWHTATIRGGTRGAVTVYFEELAWEQTLTPLDNVRKLAGSSSNSGIAQRRPQSPPTAIPQQVEIPSCPFFV